MATTTPNGAPHSWAADSFRGETGYGAGGSSADSLSHDAISAVLTVTCEALSADRATLYLYSNGQRVSRVWTTEQDPALRQYIEGASGHAVDALPVLRWLAEQQEDVVALDDTAPVDPEVARISRRLRARAFIASVSRDHPRASPQGALFVSFGAPRRLSGDQRTLVRHAARLTRLVTGGVRAQEHTVEALLMAENRVMAVEQLSSLVQGSADMTARSTPAGRVESVSSACATLIGEDPANFGGRPLVDLLGDPSDGASWEHLSDRITAAPDGVVVVVSRRPGPRGDDVWLETTARLLRDVDSGRPAELYTTTRDVTERVKEQEVVRRERDYAEALVGSMQDGLAVIGGDGRLVRTNDRLCEITGFTRDDLVGSQAPFPFWPEEAATGIRLEVAGALSRGGGEVDLVLCRATGDRFPAIVSVRPLRRTDGVLSGSVMTVKDVSERKKAIDGLRQRAAEEVALRRVATIVASKPDDPATVFATVAREVAGLLECEAGAVVRFDDGGSAHVVGSWSSVPGAVLPSSEAFTIQGSGAVCGRVSATGRAVRILHGDVEDGIVARWARSVGLRGAVAAPVVVGDRLWGVVTAATVRDTPPADDAEQRLAHFADLVAMGISTTQEREARQGLEESLRRAQKLEAVGQLAAGVAHEINTPVQYVSDSLYFLEDACTAVVSMVSVYRQFIEVSASSGVVDPVALEDLRRQEQDADLDYAIQNAPAAIERAREGARRVGEIVGAMKEFAHPSHEVRAPADLNRAIQNTIIVAQNAVKHAAIVELDLGAIPQITCHAGDISRVVLNLVVNAAHAIEEARAQSGGQGTIRVSTRAEANNVVIEVGDDGCGIPPDRLGRIFELFYTTKPEGKGTGQGLSIAHTIVVDGHGGAISVDSEVGRGSTFRVSLPTDGGPS